MQHRKILEYLEELALKLGVEIVYEKLEGEDFPAGGGLYSPFYKRNTGQGPKYLGMRLPGT